METNTGLDICHRFDRMLGVFNCMLNSHYKFAWSVDTRGLSSLAMTSLEPPNLLLYCPINQTFMLHPLYSTPGAISTLDKQQIVAFLADGVNGKLPVGFF